MAFGLPPPWDPGYALPDNVRDEGLRKRGFVTKQMPRGTYDQPEVGTGGYVVPQYVMDEGYGQGTFTTKWEPRGEYDGGKIPYWLNKRPVLLADKRRPGGGRALTFAAPITVQPYGQGSAVAMSGVPGQAALPKPLQDFGAQAADKIIQSVAMQPANQRKAYLRQAMNRIDKTLWKRTQDIAKELTRQGATPGQALRAALARALSAGLGAEILRAGQTSVAPQSNSLLGLGCSRAKQGAMGATRDGGYVLGDDASVTAVYTGPGVTKTPLTFKVNTTVSGRTLPAGSNTVPVGCPGYSWVGDHWEGTKVGKADIPAPIGSFAKCPVDVTDHRKGTGKKIKVGPFSFPADSDTPVLWKLYEATALSPEFKSALKEALSRPGGRVSSRNQQIFLAKHEHKGELGIVRDRRPEEMATAGPYQDACYWFESVGLKCGTTVWDGAGPPQYFQGPDGPNRVPIGTAIGAGWKTAGGDPVNGKAFAPPPNPEVPEYLRLKWQDIEKGVEPFAGFIHPVTGDKWGVFLSLVPDQYGTGTTRPIHLEIWAGPIPQKPWYEYVYDVLTWLPVTLFDAFEDLLGGIADIACAVVCSDVGNAVGAGTAAAAGAPPAAGSAGVDIARMLACGCAPPGTPPPPTPKAEPFPWLPVAIGGGALVAILMLSNSKKAT